MVEMRREDWHLLGRALVLWARPPGARYPQRSDQRVLDEFGVEVGSWLVPIIKKLADDYYATDAQWTVRDLGEAGRVASDAFMARNPHVPLEAVRTLEWCFTWDFK
ncbi:MAG: hypothetical protein R3E87_27255 [Burkholderiaceae bacterium]